MTIPVSVVMTAYRNSEFIPAAIESVLDQDVPSLELILVDDGSPEDIPAAISPYRDRLRYIRQENQGLGAARDTGIQESQSEFIAFCDSDDLQYSHRLSAHLALLKSFPNAALVFSDLAKYEDGKITSESTLRGRELGLDNACFDESIQRAFGSPTNCANLGIGVPNEVSNRDVFVGRVPELIAARHVAWGGASMFRKSSILGVGGHDPEVWRYEDWSLVSRLSKLNDLIYWDAPVLSYRQHSAQLTKQGAAGGARGYRDVVFKVWKDDAEFAAKNPALHRNLVLRACLHNAHFAMEEKDYTRARVDLLHCIRAAPLDRYGYTQMARSIIRQYLLDPMKRS